MIMSQFCTHVESIMHFVSYRIFDSVVVTFMFLERSQFHFELKLFRLSVISRLDIILGGKEQLS